MSGRNLTGYPTSPAQPLFSSSATQAHQLGEKFVTADGRSFRYVQAGGSALVVGDAIQARAQDADHDQLAVVTGAVGSYEITITTGASGGALDENEYAGGFAVIDTTPGLGYCYPIVGHAAIAALTNGILKLAMPLQVALTTSSKVTLMTNAYNGVIQHPVTTATNVCVGGAIYPIAASEFGWIQTGGPGAALILGTPGVGQPVTSVGATAGGLTVHSAELNIVAEMMVTGVNGKVLPVFWKIDS
jgi:hypothetical protein